MMLNFKFMDNTVVQAAPATIPVPAPPVKYRWCCNRQNETSRLIDIFKNIKELSDTQKKSLEYRYVNILKEFSFRCTRYSLLFHVGHFIITVGSLIVPALISVQYADNNVNVFSSPQLQAQIYWVTWTLSLLVTMFNGILVLYKVDKKYYFLHTTRERLRSEGWQYVQLTGRYSGVLMDHKEKATHENQLVAFCYCIERIRMKQVEEEYYKFEETQQSDISKTNTTTTTNSTQHTTDSLMSSLKKMFYEEVEKNKQSIKSQKPEDLENMFQGIVASLIISSHDKTKTKSKVTPEENATTEEAKPIKNDVVEPNSTSEEKSTATN